MTRTTAAVLALFALTLVAACGGADERDTDRAVTTPASNSVMYFDSTVAVIPGEKAAGGGAAGANGAEIFTRCAACHQATGLGMPGAYPPLAGSEWLLNNPDVPIRIVLKGLQGPITVKGTAFNSAMTPFGDQLSDAEIAAVISYERSSFGNHASPITAELVKAVRDSVKSQTAPWNPKELEGLIHAGK